MMRLVQAIIYTRQPGLLVVLVIWMSSSVSTRREDRSSLLDLPGRMHMPAGAGGITGARLENANLCYLARHMACLQEGVRCS